MSLSARCHTLRPDRQSGWLTFFELEESGPRAGHFLVVGPAAARGPEDVQAALRAGQAAVRYLKEVPDHAPPLTLLEATARILEHESAKTGTTLEFGCAVLEQRELWLLTRGAVRLVPLAPEPGVPLGADRPHAVSVTAEERYFFGPVRETPGLGPAPDLRARLERGGGGDGGLVLSIAVSARLREVEPAGTGAGESLVEGLPREAPAALPPGEPERVVPEVEVLAAPPWPAEEPPAPEAGGAMEDAAETSVLHPSTAEAGRPSRPFAPEETRGLWFWFAVVVAAIALGSLVLYLVVLRPPTRPERRSEPASTPAPPTDSTSLAGVPKRPGTPRLLWQDRFTDAVTSSPAVDGDRVVFGCRDGRVYALDRTDGRRLWSFAAENGFGSSPVRFGDRIIVGGYDGTVYALDRLTGEPRWKVVTQGRITATAAADSASVYVGSYDHRLYAIDAALGTVRWSRNLKGILWASPAVGEGLVVAAGLDGRVSAVDARDGRVRWAAALGAPIHSSPALGDGKVLVGVKDGNLVALDLADGKVLWKAATGGEVNGSPAMRDGWAVVGTESGRVVGVETATGRVAWRLETGGEVRCRPAFDGDVVWITGYDGFLRAVEWRTGKETASFPAGSSAFSSPAVAGDTVFFGGLDGRFFAVETGFPPS